MIKIENTEVMGFEASIRGMRNPMNSWDKSDSYFDGERYVQIELPEEYAKDLRNVTVKKPKYHIGDNDMELMKKLAFAGTAHSKYRRMITVYADITAPLYWWKEFDTYKVGTVSNSCSTMHKIHSKEFTLDDFSVEHLYTNNLEAFGTIISALNEAREIYLKTKEKEDWWQMIQLLPSSYNQKRTIMLNYEVLANQYKYRKNHKLDEWREYCDWIETLPYVKELIIL